MPGASAGDEDGMVRVASRDAKLNWGGDPQARLFKGILSAVASCERRAEDTPTQLTEKGRAVAHSLLLAEESLESVFDELIRQSENSRRALHRKFHSKCETAGPPRRRRRRRCR